MDHFCLGDFSRRVQKPQNDTPFVRNSLRSARLFRNPSARGVILVILFV